MLSASRDARHASRIDQEPYPLTAWESQFHRIRADLEDALERESRFAPAARTADQASYLSNSMAQWCGTRLIAISGVGAFR